MPSVGASSNTLPRSSLPELIARETRRKARRKLVFWGFGVFALLLLGAAYYVLRPKPLPFAAYFRDEPVTRGAITREVQATGRIEALVTVSVGAEISGRISQVNVDYNEQVREGQVLASFDRAGLQAQLAQARAASAAAQMALAQAQTDRSQVARTLERVQRLHAQNAASQADLESAQANAKLAGQRVEAAQAQLSAQRANLALAQTNLEHSEIRSPIDGIVITRNIDPGQTVASMLQSPTLFTVAADLRKVRVIAAVDEADIGEVEVGQHASFTVTAYPERVFEGSVVEVRNSAVITQDVVTYGAVIDADNLDLALKPGMTASVRVRTGHVDDSLRVPSAALRFTPPQQLVPSAEGTQPQQGDAVWIVDGQRLRRVAVQAGISDGELSAVTASDLHLHDRVVVDLTAAGRAAYDTSGQEHH